MDPTAPTSRSLAIGSSDMMVDDLLIAHRDLSVSPIPENLDIKALIDPSTLRKDRERAIHRIRQGAIYLDPSMGVAIFRSRPEKSLFFSQRGWKIGLNFRLDAPVEEPTPADPPGDKVPWYVHLLSEHSTPPGSWPSKFDGHGVKVAVIDSAFVTEHRCLQGAISDHFELQPNGPPRTAHGTQVASVIGARPCNGLRVSVAPACSLILGRLSINGAPYTTAVEFILLTSWAVECGARVVSYSFSAPEADTISYGASRALFAAIAGNLRQANKAIIFCAAGNRNGDSLSLPAASDGIMAIAGYRRRGHGPHDHAICVDAKAPGMNPHDPAKVDILLGPAEGILAINAFKPEPTPDIFGGTSAACAFVSGLAALYFQRLGSKATVERVIQDMKAESFRIDHPNRPGDSLLAPTFPR